MLPAARRLLFFSLCAGMLAVVFLLQSFFASRIKSPAWDETGDIAAGLSYLQTGQFTVNLQHPPLLKELSGIPLYLSGARYPGTPEAQQLLAGAARYQWTVGNQIIAAYGPDKVMFWSRLPFMLLASLLGVLVFVWGRQMMGAVAGLGALFLYALDPTVLANSYLVTMDLGLAAFTVLFFFALWHYVRYPSLRRLLLCGLALGALLATKFSAVILLPVAGLLLFAAFYRRSSAEIAQKAGPNDACPCGSGKKFKKCHGASGQKLPAGSGLVRKLALSICAFLAMCVVAIVVIEALYFFHDGPSLYLKGMSMVNADHDPNYKMYLAGSLGARFLSYFAAAYLLKEPVASIILVLLGLLAVLRSKTLSALDKLFLLLPPAVLFVAHTFLADDLGIRYILPVLPFAYLMGGLGLAELISSGIAWKRAAAGLLCAWMVVAAIGIYPDHLSYFNEAACLVQRPGDIGLDGGTGCGPLWLDDSNVDWGEGLKQLKSWLDQHAQGRPLRLAYFGSFPPEGYGIKFEKLNLQDLIADPTPGLYAVSADFVARAPALGEKYLNGAGAWLRHTKPTAIVGHCLYIYDIR